MFVVSGDLFNHFVPMDALSLDGYSLILGGTIRSAFSSRPLMRRNPICKARPSLSDGSRRCSISWRSGPENVKRATAHGGADAGVECQLSEIVSLRLGWIVVSRLADIYLPRSMAVRPALHKKEIGSAGAGSPVVNLGIHLAK